MTTIATTVSGSLGTIVITIIMTNPITVSGRLINLKNPFAVATAKNKLENDNDARNKPTESDDHFAA